jgi:hypothetical protein
MILASKNTIPTGIKMKQTIPRKKKIIESLIRMRNN